MIEVWEHTRPEVLGLLRGLDYGLERIEDSDLNVNNYLATPG